jgi:hypothetical protein
MSPSTIYVAISIIVLALIVLFIVITRKSRKVPAITPLAGLAFGCVVAGLVFGAERMVGYPLLGTGMVLAIIDIVRSLRSRRSSNPNSV